MKQISYTSDETFYAAGTGIEDARERSERGQFAQTPQGAWNLLGYDDFGVFEFRVTEKVTKVNPPYTK